MHGNIMNRKEIASKWFENLRDEFCKAFEEIEREAAEENTNAPVFERKKMRHRHR
jgi:coproporphyrinogen III oxidase